MVARRHAMWLGAKVLVTGVTLLAFVLGITELRGGAPGPESHLVAYLSFEQPAPDGNSADLVDWRCGLAHSVAQGMHLPKGNFAVVDGGHWFCFDCDVTITESTLKIFGADGKHLRTESPLLEGHHTLSYKLKKRSLQILPDEAVFAGGYSPHKREPVRLEWTISVSGPKSHDGPWSARFTVTATRRSATLRVTRWWDSDTKMEEFSVVDRRLHGVHRRWSKDGVPQEDHYWWEGSRKDKETYLRKAEAEKDKSQD